MKASVLFGAGWETDSIEVLWRDAGRAFCRLSRDDNDVGRHAFIPVLSDAEHPTLDSLNRLTHEFELREYLDAAWALRPWELVRDRGQMMLVVELGQRASARTIPGWPSPARAKLPLSLRYVSPTKYAEGLAGRPSLQSGPPLTRI